MTLRPVLVMLAIAACSRTNGAAPEPPPAAAPKPPPATSPRGPAVRVERPASVLQAPWSEIDFSASDAELRRQFGATEAPDCGRGTYKTNGLCWGSDDRTGDQVVVTQTSSTITLEPLMPLRETIALMRSLVGLSHEATTQKLGKRGSHRQPVCEGILCFFTLPPNDGGDVSGAIEFADGVATHASYVAWCGPDCAMRTAILAAFDKAFGARKTESRPYEATGELWTYHTYASTPGLVIKSRDYAPDFLFVCVGACD